MTTPFQRVSTVLSWIGVMGLVTATMLVLLFTLVHHSSKPLSTAIVSQLDSLAYESLESKDIPVAALLVYGDHIVGRGFNTVKRDGDAGGHAEVNAISDAMQRIGLRTFAQLNRDSLTLISTFEPCAMCRGAIIEYRIRRVEFLKPKPSTSLLREELRTLLYLYTRATVEPYSLQDSLFRQHPDYRGGE